jgi:hypothetical protein
MQAPEQPTQKTTIKDDIDNNDDNDYYSCVGIIKTRFVTLTINIPTYGLMIIRVGMQPETKCHPVFRVKYFRLVCEAAQWCSCFWRGRIDSLDKSSVARMSHEIIDFLISPA